MGNKSKYKRLTDLYVLGTEVVFEDGTVMWCQAMNPFEADEARRDAQAARSRLTMALKEVGSDEYDALTGVFYARGAKRIKEDILSAKTLTWYMDAQNELEVDPDWKDRVAIIKRTDNLTALPQDPAEAAFLEKISNEWAEAIQNEVNLQRDLLSSKLDQCSEEELISEYKDLYLERRGNDTAIAEYNMTEMWYGCRECEGVETDGRWDHQSCNHKLRVFEDRAEIRELPESLVAAIRKGFDQLAMTARDARFSPRQGSSSQSSPLPSEPEE